MTSSRSGPAHTKAEWVRNVTILHFNFTSFGVNCVWSPGSLPPQFFSMASHKSTVAIWIQIDNQKQNLVSITMHKTILSDDKKLWYLKSHNLVFFSVLLYQQLACTKATLHKVHESNVKKVLSCYLYAVVLFSVLYH
jgi:hypothetical protein